MSIRTERVAGVIREELSRVLLRDLDTSGFGLLSITDVIMTADLRIAKVYVSSYHADVDRDTVLGFFEKHARELRMAVGRSVRLKFTPELRFYYDETLDRVERFDRIFKDIHKQDEDRSHDVS